MKVLVYGSKGWIGSQFINILMKNKIKFLEGKSRVENKVDLEKEIDEYEPTHIISLIGRTHGICDNVTYSTIDYLEQEGKLFENVRDNLFSPLLLAHICSTKNIHFTYLGTGCIFQYDEQHPFEQEINGFTEESLPNFFGSSYSIVKGFTDQLMKLYDTKCLNLRIRMPITNNNNPRNFITKIVNYEKICSVSNSMTVLPELLPIALDLMKYGETGTFNLTNPGVISHNEILTLYRDIVDNNFTWENFAIEAQNEILESKRSNNYLDTKKLEKLYPDVKHIKIAIKEILLDWK
jgi:nucleoside-diphosphate-sugar epimerase